ncbi:MAG: hypothetical protein HOP16_12770 [Acidobacteria bacterium]|nr:hypothetical protein [Acidobacteriota bacterium]
MSGSVVSRWSSIGLAVPGCVLAAASALALTLAAVDRHPMWPYTPLNLAEAAGTRDEAEVTRLVENGADATAAYSVRPGLMFDVETRLTPLEAAVAVRDPEMLARLFDLGIPINATLWTRLRCLADERRVGPLLDTRRPADADMKCDGVVPPWPRQ